MNRDTKDRRPTRRLTAIAAIAGLLAGAAGHAQVPVDADGNPVGTAAPGARVENPTHPESLLSVTELEDLVGPVALYPDDLLAIVLPASTYPLQIVQAARFLDEVDDDPGLEPDPEWDDSVVALLNYPEVLRMMNEDIDWTWRLGEAVVDQQPDVIAAVERFRDRAYAAGNLQSDRYQTVSRNDDVIEIEPVNDDVIYVPYYEPARVVVYSPTPVYYYYPRPYPVYYYPYPRGHYLTAGYFWGVTTAFRIGWWHDYLHVYHHSYTGHPYYGHRYYGSYWRQPSLYVHNTWYVHNHVHVSTDRHRYGDYWRPRHRSGARPVQRVSNEHYYRDRRHADRDVRPRRHDDGRSVRDRRADQPRYRAAGTTRPRVTLANPRPRQEGGVGRTDNRQRSLAPEGRREPVTRIAGRQRQAALDRNGRSSRAAPARNRGAEQVANRGASRAAPVRNGGADRARRAAEPRRQGVARAPRQAVQRAPTSSRRTVSRPESRTPARRAAPPAVRRQSAPPRASGFGSRPASRSAAPRTRAPSSAPARAARPAAPAPRASKGSANRPQGGRSRGSTRTRPNPK